MKSGNKHKHIANKKWKIYLKQEEKKTPKKLTHGKKSNKSFLFSDRKVTNLLFLILNLQQKNNVALCTDAVFLYFNECMCVTSIFLPLLFFLSLSSKHFFHIFNLTLQFDSG